MSDTISRDKPRYKLIQKESVIDIILRCLTTHYLNFKDRASPREFFVFMIFQIHLKVFWVLVCMGLKFSSDIFVFGEYIFFALLLLPSMSVGVRRLHDYGWNGAIPIVMHGLLLFRLFFPMLSPVITVIYVGYILLGLISGSRNENKYGPTLYEVVPPNEIESDTDLSLFRIFVTNMTTKYGRFKGRDSQRSMFAMFFYGVCVYAMIVAGLYWLAKDDSSLQAVIIVFAIWIWVIGFTTPFMMCMMRRLHDLNVSGIWLFVPLPCFLLAPINIVFVFIPPLVWFIALMNLMIYPTNKKPNKYDIKKSD